MVATSNALAVEAALWALGEGGTAMDAALASDAVLGLVQPMSSGVGGDAFCLVDDGRDVAGFNGSGAAPGALTLEACTAPGAWSDTSPLGVTVPGVVDAWAQLSERYGRLGLARVLEPAIALAGGEFPLGRAASRRWGADAERIRPGCPLPGAPAPGERIGNPELAVTLRAVAEGGRDAHYTGSWARAAVAAAREAGSPLALEDLAAHRGEWVDPIDVDYRGHQVLQLPPNGQGAAALAALTRLGRAPLGPARDPETLATVMTAVREGMEEAYRHVADPRWAAVPPFWKGGDTVYTAVWAGGMAVSLISSVFYSFGSGIWAAGAFLQNRGYGFSLEPDHPNAVAGGKRPFHTIIPALLRRGGRTDTVFGVVGGPMQPQAQVQILANLLDHGLDPQAALEAPRAFWLGDDQIAIERHLPRGTRAALTDAGFDVLPNFISRFWFGAGQIVRAHEDGWLEGGSDPRHDGLAVGALG
jgi:gamma-glutamyltranspeptidase / glutathione hydrolase